MPSPKIKICGLKDQNHLDACEKHGADFVGLVFYPASSRFIEPHDAANLKTSIQTVGLFVDPSLTDIARCLEYIELDMIQCHGHESPDDIALIKNTFKKPVMKAIGIKDTSDLQSISQYADIADWLLFDTKTPDHGGSGRSFDWSLLKDVDLNIPWMLAGGLNASNIQHALSILQPSGIDVSSGVEQEKGIKDSEKIINFINTVKTVRD